MSARLKPGESPREGLRRIVLDQIAKALDDLAEVAEPAETVHSARKRLKRLRALLRLARDGMDPAIYDREKTRLRGAARPLAEARDAAVLVDTLDDLVERSGDLGPHESIARTRDVLLERKSDATRRALGDGSAIDGLAATLGEAKEALGGDVFRGVTWPILRAGLRRIYRRGRRAFRAAGESPTVENLHGWRKRVKDLGYALEVVEPIRPSVVRQRVNLSDELAESLGDDHDLAVLRQALLAGAGTSPAVVALLPVIDARRAQLQESTFALGRKVYRERPRDFAARLDASWHEWRSRATAR
jgi:CHAD domain-containing protein